MSWVRKIFPTQYFYSLIGGVEEIRSKFARGYCERASDEFWPPAPLIVENLAWSRRRNAINKTTNDEQIKLRSLWELM